MIRISALNECTEPDVNAEDLEVQVTKEAQVGSFFMPLFCIILNLIFKGNHSNIRILPSLVSQARRQ